MRRFWRTLLQSPSGLIGFVILVFIVAMAIIGPLLFPTSPWRMVQRPFLPPFSLATSPLGADALGHDERTASIGLWH